jgi:alpha-1,6-mannosyltransferase
VAENPIALAETRGPDASRRRSPFVLPALAGAVGAGLLALAGDLPGSPYGPHAGGLWPLAATGSAPGWEGPQVPSWADVADQGPGVGPGRLLVTLAVIAGVGLLGLAWITLWRRARAEPHRGWRHLWWVVGAWTAPLLFAAPLASQDVWLSGAQGKMVLGGFGGYRPASLLGHSVWTLAVDPKWAARPSFYGPGSLDLSALFVKISGGRPWVAAECWRITAILGLVLCAWGVGRIVSRRGGDATPATLAAAANPAMLIVLVAGIHNDALMLGLIVAGTALAVSQSRAGGMVLCALGVAVKPNALLAAGALAWWAWGTRWRQRTRGALAAATAVVGVLVVTGFGLS